MFDRKTKLNKKPASRSKKIFYNMGSSILYQLIAIISNLILPRLFLTYFGSNTNGLINSITQFLSYIALLDLGVGAVFQSALYKPLAQKDKKEINNVFCAGKLFYNRIGIVIVAYIVVLAVTYPYFVKNTFGYFSTIFLVLAMSISTFAQYFLGLVYQTFLTADQKHYIQSNISSATLVANTVVSVLLIQSGCSVQIVKLSTSCIYLLRPLLMKSYVDKNYDIDYKTRPSKDAIPQKWNGFAQHLAAVVLNNTDVAVLTFFSTLKNVSIYSVYYMIVSAIKQMITLVTSAVTPTLGNMYGLNEDEKFNSSFEFFEWLIHSISVLLFTVTAILITPFVLVYTRGVSDANYSVPVFGYLMCAAFLTTCLQQPYKILTQVVGHYKQTQASSIVEAAINIVISVFMVFKYGLIGVAIGTLAAMLYRMIYLENYIQNNIFNRKKTKFVKLIAVDLISIVIMVGSTSWINLNVANYAEWIRCAVIISVICGVCAVVINMIFFREQCKSLLYNRVFQKILKVKRSKS
jgi:O-antigen/teichoic acid export membrane protein